MALVADVTIKQGEAKTLKFIVTNGGDLSATTVKFAAKRQKRDTTYVVEKADAAFDKSEAATSILYVPLSATDTNQTSGFYYGELKITFAADNIDKSADIIIEIEHAVITT